MTEYERGFIDGVKSKVSAELTPTLINVSKTMLEMLKPVLSTALENALNDNNAITDTDVQSVNKWISVKDRLPKIIDNISSEDVLIHLENGEQYVAVLIGDDNENRIEAYYWSTSDMHRDFECDVVTHWQQLPEEPKMGGSQNG